MVVTKKLILLPWKSSTPPCFAQRLKETLSIIQMEKLCLHRCEGAWGPFLAQHHITAQPLGPAWLYDCICLIWMQWIMWIRFVLTPLSDQPSGGRREKEEVFFCSFDLKEGWREKDERKEEKKEGKRRRKRKERRWINQRSLFLNTHTQDISIEIKTCFDEILVRRD